jgi:haloalkane dehalogenase
MDHRDFANLQRHVTLSGVARVPVDVAFVDYGSPMLDDVIVLMHGIPTWSYLYSDVIPLISSRYRILAVDFLGHGYSERRDVCDRSLEAQAVMIRRLLQELDIDSVHLVGHDTGGGVALILAIDHPEILRTVTISNAVAYDSWPIDDMIQLGDPHWSTKPAAEIADFVRAGLTDGISRREQLTAEWSEGIVAPYADAEGALSLIRNAAALNTNHTSALTPLLHTISTPTLLLWGEDDPWQKIDDARRLNADIPGSTLVAIEGASHWIPRDAPREFAEVLESFIG